MSAANDERGHQGLPPGPRAPGAVQTLQWMYRQIPLLQRCRSRYGPTFSLRLGPARNAVVVSRPREAAQVITGDPSVYRAGDANGIVRPVVGPNSILVLDGAEHSFHRKLLLPAFGSSHADHFADQVRRITEERVSGWPAGKTIRLQPEMEAISFEAILRVALGEGDPRASLLRPLIPEMMRRSGSPFTILPWFRRELGGLSPYGRLRGVLDRLDEIFFDAIRDRRESPSLGGDALSLLVSARHEDGTPLSEKEVRDELLTLIMAGYETTTSGLAWSFERLLRAPDALSRLLAELETGDEAYLEAVIKETLRHRPVVPVVARKLADSVELAGYTIPSGSVLMASIYLLHRDPEVYPDPGAFRPERFLDRASDPGSWIPFGGGVRRCLGASFATLEMKVVLRTVLRMVKLRAPDPADEPVARRRFTFTPGRHAEAVVEAAV